MQFVEVKGDSCSVSCSTHACELLHPVTLYPLQLSCSSSSPELRNRVRFQRYFQLLPTDLDLVPGFFGTMQYYGWKQVVIVQQEENLFSQVSYTYSIYLCQHDYEAPYVKNTDIYQTSLICIKCHDIDQISWYILNVMI